MFHINLRFLLTGLHKSPVKANLIQFEEKYENVLNEDNIDDIINKLSE